jgi:small subunit ribosomal protein S11
MASSIRAKISSILSSTVRCANLLVYCICARARVCVRVFSNHCENLRFFQVAASNRISVAAAASATGPDSIIVVKCTMNNIHVVISNIEGEVVSKCSGGVLGLKHRARASPLAGLEIAKKAASTAVSKGYALSHVEMKGPSRGRGQVLQGIAAAGLRVFDIRDVTPVPTNGCRPPSVRRL